MYAIVKFIEENDAPGIVCLHWLDKDNNTCVYPNVRTNEARDRLLKKQVGPSPDWSSCRVKVLQKYNTFKAALQHLSRAEETSNLESEDESPGKKRAHKRKHLVYPGEESDEESVSLLQPKRAKKSNYIPYPVPPNEHIYAVQTREEFIFPEKLPVPPREATPPQQSIYSSQTEELTPSSLHLPSTSFSNQNVINGRLEAWMADISQKIQRLEGKMDSIINVLTSQRSHIQEHSVEDFNILGALPVTNDGSFMDLNRKLSENNFRNLLIKVFVSVGGKDLRSQIHNMLRKVMHDEVAELYSLSGKSTIKNSAKKSFLATNVYNSMFSACRRVFKDQATEVQIKEAIADWLHQAKVRRNRRLFIIFKY